MNTTNKFNNRISFLGLILAFMPTFIFLYINPLSDAQTLQIMTSPLTLILIGMVTGTMLIIYSLSINKTLKDDYTQREAEMKELVSEIANNNFLTQGQRLFIANARSQHTNYFRAGKNPFNDYQLSFATEVYKAEQVINELEKFISYYISAMGVLANTANKNYTHSSIGQIKELNANQLKLQELIKKIQELEPLAFPENTPKIKGIEVIIA